MNKDIKQVHIFYSNIPLSYNLLKLERNCNRFIDDNENVWIRTFNILKKVGVLQLQGENFLVEICVWRNEFKKPTNTGRVFGLVEKKTPLSFSRDEKKKLMINLRTSIEKNDLTGQKKKKKRKGANPDDENENSSDNELPSNSVNIDDDDASGYTDYPDKPKHSEDSEEEDDKKMKQKEDEDVEPDEPNLNEDEEVELMKNDAPQSFKNHLASHEQEKKNDRKTQNLHAETLKQLKKGGKKPSAVKRKSSMTTRVRVSRSEKATFN